MSLGDDGYEGLSLEQKVVFCIFWVACCFHIALGRGVPLRTDACAGDSNTKSLHYVWV